jgi:hypothetical protein
VALPTWFTDNPTPTSCTDNVATTVVPRDTTAATKGIVGLQGKPQVRFAQASNNVVWVRAKSPTREFNVADGAVVAASGQRRMLVDTEKCNKCHIGTLYQHGGNRVDNNELCVMCHNPASSEQNRRVGMGVTASEAYDGLAGQTYDMRYMVHAIHAAGAHRAASPGWAAPDTNGLRMQIPGPLVHVGKPLMYYRSNGIFFFGSKESEATLPNWPLNLANNGQSWRENGISHARVIGRVAPPIKAGCPALWEYLEARLSEAERLGWFGSNGRA